MGVDVVLLPVPISLLLAWLLYSWLRHRTRNTPDIAQKLAGHTIGYRIGLFVGSALRKMFRT